METRHNSGGLRKEKEMTDEDRGYKDRIAGYYDKMKEVEMTSKTELFELAEKLYKNMYGPEELIEIRNSEAECEDCLHRIPCYQNKIHPICDKVWADATKWAEDILNGIKENPFETKVKKGE